MSGENEVNISQFKRYLLGNLAPAEAEAIDLRIIADEISEETLSWAESELIEDYLEKTLAPPEIALFEKKFLASPERRRHLEEISLMKNFARRTDAQSTANAERGGETFFQKLIKFFTLDFRPAFAVGVLLVICSGVMIYYFAANNRTAAEREFAAINRRDLSNPAEYNSVFTINLANGTFRGADGAAAIKLPANQPDDKILFRLAVPTAAAGKYKIELSSGQKVVFTQTGLPLYDNPNGRELRFFLPAATLVNGRYQIKAAAENSPDSVFTYNFALE